MRARPLFPRRNSPPASASTPPTDLIDQPVSLPYWKAIAPPAGAITNPASRAATVLTRLTGLRSGTRPDEVGTPVGWGRDRCDRDAAGVAAAGVQAERRVLVTHQRDVGQHPVAPAVHPHDEVEDRLRVPAPDGEHHGGDEGEEGDQPGPTGHPPGTHPPDTPPAGEDRHHQIVRQGQQPPLDEDEPSGEVLGIVDREGGRIVRLRAEAERWVAIGAESADGVEGHAPRPAHDAEIEVEDRAGIPAGEDDY